MLNRRHIRTVVIQSIYSNSVELLDHSTLKTYITKSSTTTLDLLYCMIDFIKEINIHFNNIESKKSNFEILIWAKKNIKKPIIAIGGITDKNYKKLIKSGANYIAISTFIWNNPFLKPEIAIRKLK